MVLDTTRSIFTRLGIEQADKRQMWARKAEGGRREGGEEGGQMGVYLFALHPPAMFQLEFLLIIMQCSS